MILTESRSLAGVLRNIAREFRVRIASTNGQVGGFLRTDVAPMLWPGARVLYLGDYDLSGGQIEDNTRGVLTSTTPGRPCSKGHTILCTGRHTRIPSVIAAMAYLWTMQSIAMCFRGP